MISGGTRSTQRAVLTWEIRRSRYAFVALQLASHVGVGDFFRRSGATSADRPSLYAVVVKARVNGVSTCTV